MTSPDLAVRLASFRIDRGTPELTFAARLAAENRWTEPFADRVMREYLRFIYLAAVSERPVTPSVAVDQAWHLHLCFTRSYWDDLCGGVLGRPLHHGPTRGGGDEAKKFRAQYDATLKLYQEEIGEVPPDDIWPKADRRFSPDGNPVTLTPDRFLIVEKSRIRTVGRVAAICGAGVLGKGAVAQSGVEAVVVPLFAAGLVLIVIWMFRRSGKGRKGGNGSGGGGCGGDSGCGSGCGGGCGGGD